MVFLKSFLFRYFRFFLILLAVFLAVEIGLLYYVNSIFLTDRGEYKAVKINTSAASVSDFKVQGIPSDAEDLSVSHDGRYVAYLVGSDVKVLDMTNGQAQDVGQAEKMEVSCFNWLYDRDRLILAEKNTDGDYAKLFYWDVKDKNLTEIRQNSSNDDIRIDLTSSSDEISQIDFSTETVKTYLKVTSKSGRSKLWIVDAFDGIKSRSGTVTRDIGKIQCLKTADKLLYESKETGKVYLYGKSRAVSIDGHTSLKLVGYDESDNVYFAALSGGLTRTVYRASYNTDEGTWSSTAISLGQDVNPSNIYVTYGGTVYYNDKANYRLVKVQENSDSGSSSGESASSSDSSSSAGTSDQSSSGTPFKGKIIGIYSSGFLALYSGQIIPYAFK